MNLATAHPALSAIRFSFAFCLFSCSLVTCFLLPLSCHLFPVPLIFLTFPVPLF
uniref:Uncharacterized protein n=1 Tax=Siphoviridae sp. ctLmu1 TaxID=2826253 RepID=A0A8S5NHH3_9CAUD|nr:MAG TPA: hypothetical protein [Siphoviridae sp. ctLmu1]DAG20938.1 MAG TPA: hypothetical protein [Caudoviricetes sp.]